MLVFGPESMLGNCLIKCLNQRGYRVFTCGRSKSCDIFMDLETGFDDHRLRVSDIECFFHCAAAFEDDSWDGAIRNEIINAVGCYHVAKLAVALQCRHLVYAGSIFSYVSNILPQTSYGASKLRGEDILEWCLTRHRIEFMSLRFTQLFDEYAKCCRHQKWFGRIVAYAFDGDKLRLPPGKAARNFLHVKDAAELMILTAEKKITGRHPVTHPQSTTNLEMAELAYNTFQNGGFIEIAQEKNPFKEIYIPDSAHFYSEMNWRPAVDIEMVLKRIAALNTGSLFGPKDVN